MIAIDKKGSRMQGNTAFPTDTMTGRRAVLGGLSALAASLLLPGQAGATRRLPLGIQLYMLGPDAMRDMPGTLAAVRAAGFTDVELPSLMNKTPEAMAAMLHAADLQCSSIHIPLEGISMSLAEPDRIIDILGALGARYAVVPLAPLKPRLAPGENWFAGMDREARAMTVTDWQRIAERLNHAGQAMARHGLYVGYHNHDLELRQVADTDQNGLDILLAATDPRHVIFEMDIGWVAAAGADPVALLKKHPRRFHLLHLKDIAARSAPGESLRMKPANLGAGIIDWPNMLKAIRQTDVAHAFVEQEPPFVGPRIDAARAAAKYLSDAGY